MQRIVKDYYDHLYANKVDDLEKIGKFLERHKLPKLKFQEEKENEVGEDTTKYGEFISTYFAWIPLSKQKERAREMENMTKKDRQKNKNLG